MSLGGVEGQGIFKILDVRTKKKKKRSSLFFSCGSENQVPLIEPEPNFYQVADVPPSEKSSVRGLGFWKAEGDGAAMAGLREAGAGFGTFSCLCSCSWHGQCLSVPFLGPRSILLNERGPRGPWVRGRTGTGIPG